MPVTLAQLEAFIVEKVGDVEIKHFTRVRDVPSEYLPPVAQWAPRARINLYHLTTPREPEATIALAHAYGHHRAFLEGHRTEAYEAATAVVLDDLGPEGKTLILSLEERAWAHAGELLKTLGMDDFTTFELLRLESLASCRARLGG